MYDTFRSILTNQKCVALWIEQKSYTRPFLQTKQNRLVQAKLYSQYNHFSSVCVAYREVLYAVFGLPVNLTLCCF